MVEGVNLLRVLTSPLLTSEGFAHAFFTRHGGVSQGAHATLNFSASTGDPEENVRRNLAVAAGRLGVQPGKLYLLSQVHGARVITLSGEEPREEILRIEGDALLSGRPGIACGVRVADCVPVLLADARSGLACAIHAGWRGAVAGVVPAALDALCAAAPSPPELLAAIGPHLSADAFEIGEEVAAQLEAAAPGEQVVVRAPGRKPHGDLARLVTWQLRRRGVERIERVPGCTFFDPGRFFSFRRDGARSGRHLAAIVPRSPR
jgi:YfiH family protein